MGVGLGTGHARIAIAQHDDVVVADDRGGLGQLLHAQLGKAGTHLGGVESGIEDVPLLAARAADQHGTDAFGVAPGHSSGTLRRLVVGVGMDGQQAQRLRHADHATGQESPKLHSESEEGLPA
jgi:hypothetical protein